MTHKPRLNRALQRYENVRFDFVHKPDEHRRALGAVIIHPNRMILEVAQAAPDDNPCVVIGRERGGVFGGLRQKRPAAWPIVRAKWLQSNVRQAWFGIWAEDNREYVSRFTWDQFPTNPGCISIHRRTLVV